MSGAKGLRRFLSEYVVVIIFLTLAIAAIPFSGLTLPYIIQEMLTRLGRNTFLVLSLLIPIYAGLGLNFGMVLGAMAGEVGLIFAVDWNLLGVQGILFACLVGTPISILLGWFCGVVFNKAKGREMVTGYILGFFMSGVYQFFGLYLMGTLIKIHSSNIMLSRGYGIRNILDISGVRQSLDTLVNLKVGTPPFQFNLPIVTYFVLVVLCIFIVWFKKTKLGQDMRAVGYDMTVADAAGVPVEKTRILAIVISTVLACYGQVIFLQNMGTMATYTSHDQTGFFAIAAILVGGASVKKATIPNVFIGVILLHLLFVVTPRASMNVFNNAGIGEYFRQFIGYGVIALSLVLYAWRSRREANRAREGLRGGAGSALSEGGAK
jgi:simple sugar transport system permease protein